MQAEGYTDGASVGTPTTGWPDEMGNANVVTQGQAAQRPTYRASYANLGGHPTVDFDGGDQLSTAAFGVSPTYPATWVAIGHLDTLAVDYATIVDSSTSANRNLVRAADDNDQYVIYAGTVVRQGAAKAGAHLYVAYFDGASGDDWLEVDGARVVEGDAGNRGINATSGFQIGDNDYGFDGGLTLVGCHSGDITQEAGWPTFVAWQKNRYGTGS